MSKNWILCLQQWSHNISWASQYHKNTITNTETQTQNTKTISQKLDPLPPAVKSQYQLSFLSSRDDLSPFLEIQEESHTVIWVTISVELPLSFFSWCSIAWLEKKPWMLLHSWKQAYEPANPFLEIQEESHTATIPICMYNTMPVLIDNSLTEVISG